MAKHHKLELTETEIQALVELRDKGEPAYLRERATVLLKIHQGSSPHEVACKGLLKARDPDTLLPNQQFLRRSEITSSEGIEIDAARDALTDVIPTIPIRRTRLALIIASRLMPQVQTPHNSPIYGVDSQRHLRRLGEMIRYPRFRIERVRIVVEQCCLCWDYQRQ